MDKRYTALNTQKSATMSNTIINHKIDQERKRIKKTEQAIEWADKHGLLDLPDGLVRDAYVSEGLAIKIAPGRENFRQMRRAIGSGWQRARQFVNDDGDIFIDYFRRDEPISPYDFPPHLLVVVDADYADGASCRVETVGTKTVEIKRIVCSD